jgi:antitoxin VapB
VKAVFLDTVGEGPCESTERFAVLLAQIDRIPERPDACDPLEWDEHGLPR